MYIVLSDFIVVIRLEWIFLALYKIMEARNSVEVIWEKTLKKKKEGCFPEISLISN
jgi:hypothetical protein